MKDPGPDQTTTALPDRTFDNFRASKSVDHQFLSLQNLSIERFRDLKVVKCWVVGQTCGAGSIAYTHT